MGKGLPGCIGIFGVIILLAVIVEAISPIARSLVQFLVGLFTLAMVGAVIWLVIDIKFGQQKQETVVIRGIDPRLHKALAQVEGQYPIDVIPALTMTSVDMTSVEWQESVISDIKWGSLKMTFVRDTDDGKLYTTVYSEQEKASVTMVLNNDKDPLVEVLEYVNVLYWRTPHPPKESPETVRYVREWIRQQILPELEAAKTHRESESGQLAAERASKLEEERRKIEEERRKREKLRQKYFT